MVRRGRRRNRNAGGRRPGHASGGGGWLVRRGCDHDSWKCRSGSEPDARSNSAARGLANGKKRGMGFYAGTAGLYGNRVLVGGLGVSGDGVGQDVFVTSAGTKGFEAPVALRADQSSISSVRLPYFKFPRNPTNLDKFK